MAHEYPQQLLDFAAQNDVVIDKNLPVFETLNLKNFPGNQWAKADLTFARKLLREELQAKALIEEMPTEFSGEFYGSGDSGSYEFDTGHLAVDRFFEEMCEVHVTFDWYNNEGGGGDIHWDIMTDKITLNGYYNVTHQEDVMIDEMV